MDIAEYASLEALRGAVGDGSIEAGLLIPAGYDQALRNDDVGRLVIVAKPEDIVSALASGYRGGRCAAVRAGPRRPRSQPVRGSRVRRDARAGPGDPGSPARPRGQCHDDRHLHLPRGCRAVRLRRAEPGHPVHVPDLDDRGHPADPDARAGRVEAHARDAHAHPPDPAWASCWAVSVWPCCRASSSWSCRRSSSGWPGATCSARTLVVVLFALIGTGAALIIGVFARNPDQAGAIGVVAGMVLGAIGGAMVPAELFEEPISDDLAPHATRLGYRRAAGPGLPWRRRRRDPAAAGRARGDGRRSRGRRHVGPTPVAHPHLGPTRRDARGWVLRTAGRAGPRGVTTWQGQLVGDVPQGHRDPFPCQASHMIDLAGRAGRRRSIRAGSCERCSRHCRQRVPA